jgi:hypothetical protein
VRWDLQGSIEAHLERRSFFQLEIPIGQQAGLGSRNCARCAAGAVTVARSCADTGAKSCACGRVCDRLLYSRPLAFDLTLGTLVARHFDPVFAGDSGDGCDQRNPSVVGFDFVEAEQEPRVQPLCHGTDMTLDFLAAGNHVAVRGNEIFIQLDFEMLAPSGTAFDGVMGPVAGSLLGRSMLTGALFWASAVIAARKKNIPTQEENLFTITSRIFWCRI